MKTTIISKMTRNISLSVLIALLVSLSTACARKMTFSTSSVVPAAEGSIKVSKDKNKNYVIKVFVANLAGIERLQPQKQSYVVWMVTEEGQTKNLGQINSSKSFLSNKLKASFKTVSSFKPVKILITAENDPDAQYPCDMLVLSTEQH